MRLIEIELIITHDGAQRQKIIHRPRLQFHVNCTSFVSIRFRRQFTHCTKVVQTTCTEIGLNIAHRILAYQAIDDEHGIASCPVPSHGKGRGDKNPSRSLPDVPEGIAEYDGGLCHIEAEKLAFDCCIVEWLDQNHTPSDPGLCVYCGLSGIVAPFGTEATGNAGLHDNCWKARTERHWSNTRQTFVSMGVYLSRATHQL